MLFLEGRWARAQILGCRRDRLPVHIYYGIGVWGQIQISTQQVYFYEGDGDNVN